MIQPGMTVKVRGWRGIAFDVRSVDGYMVQAVMVGDDRVHKVDVKDCEEINDDEFCSECGQMGCGNG